MKGILFNVHPVICTHCYDLTHPPIEVDRSSSIHSYAMWTGLKISWFPSRSLGPDQSWINPAKLKTTTTFLSLTTNNSGFAPYSMIKAGRYIELLNIEEPIRQVQLSFIERYFHSKNYSSIHTDDHICNCVPRHHRTGFKWVDNIFGIRMSIAYKDMITAAAIRSCDVVASFQWLPQDYMLLPLWVRHYINVSFSLVQVWGVNYLQVCYMDSNMKDCY